MRDGITRRKLERIGAASLGDESGMYRLPCYPLRSDIHAVEEVQIYVAEDGEEPEVSLVSGRRTGTAKYGGARILVRGVQTMAQLRRLYALAAGKEWPK